MERGSQKRSRGARIRRALGLASFGVVLAAFALTGHTPTLRCADGECIVEKAFFWIPYGEVRFSVTHVERVIQPGPWDRTVYFVELDDGQRVSVHRSSPGRSHDFSRGVLRRFLENDPRGELLMETRGADPFWLMSIPFFIAGMILIEYDD